MYKVTFDKKLDKDTYICINGRVKNKDDTLCNNISEICYFVFVPAGYKVSTCRQRIVECENYEALKAMFFDELGKYNSVEDYYSRNRGDL